MDYSEPVEIPIDGILDLHTFRPDQVQGLIPDYFRDCRQKGIFRVRIIHGKGIGALKNKVYSVLERTPGVDSFGPASSREGGWGATIVFLTRKN